MLVISSWQGNNPFVAVEMMSVVPLTMKEIESKIKEITDGGGKIEDFLFIKNITIYK